MLVPDEIRQCVLFLGNKDPKTGQFRPRATAFAVSIHQGTLGFRFLVTAEHNIDAFAKRGWEIYLRSNLKNGGVREDSWASARWYHHPNVGSTDVAVSTINFHPEEEFKTILLRTDGPISSQGNGLAGIAEVLKDRNLGVGDEVFLVGLFRSHSGKQRNIPIIRVGNLATMRGEPVATEFCGETDAYLVEARSIGGLSGSPVFIRAPLWQVRDGGNISINQGPQFYLLGLMHGHFDVTSLHEGVVDADEVSPRGINTGIGVVIPVEKILETIDQPELVELRQKAIEEHESGDAPYVTVQNPTTS
jgi:hypothetical protein